MTDELVRDLSLRCGCSHEQRLPCLSCRAIAEIERLSAERDRALDALNSSQLVKAQAVSVYDAAYRKRLDEIEALRAQLDEWRAVSETLAIRLLCETPTGHRQTETSVVLCHLSTLSISKTLACMLAEDAALNNWMENHVE